MEDPGDILSQTKTSKGAKRSLTAEMENGSLSNNKSKSKNSKIDQVTLRNRVVDKTTTPKTPKPQGRKRKEHQEECLAKALSPELDSKKQGHSVQKSQDGTISTVELFEEGVYVSVNVPQGEDQFSGESDEEEDKIDEAVSANN